MHVMAMLADHTHSSPHLRLVPRRNDARTAANDSCSGEAEPAWLENWVASDNADRKECELPEWLTSEPPRMRLQRASGPISPPL